MKQIVEQKVKSRSVDLYLKKDSHFNEQDSVKLIKNISNKSKWLDSNGSEVDVSNLSLMDMVNQNLKRSGKGGWHEFEEAFERKFSNHNFSGDGSIEESLNEAYKLGQNDFGNIFGKNRPCRSVSVGDVLVVQEWGLDGKQLDSSPRHFLVASVGFDEFKRATGEFL